MDFVNINVGGTVFSTQFSTLSSLPDSRLGRLTTKSDEYNRVKGWFFFDRNPEMFQNILDLYRHGNLHVPGNICGATLKRELKYWKIPLNKIPVCCLAVICRHEEMMTSLEHLKISFASDEVAFSEMTETKKSESFAPRRNVWLFFTSRKSSLAAKIFNAFYYLMASLSMIPFILGSHPAFRDPRPADGVFETEKLEISPKYKMYFTTSLKEPLRIIDQICLIFFTFELFLRLLTCPSIRKFYKSFFYCLDTVVIAILLIAFGLEQQKNLIVTSNKIFWLYFVCKSTVILRRIGLFRLSKDIGGLQVLTLAVKSTIRQLLSLGTSVLITIVFCSSVIYYAEIYQETSLFTNIPITVWWSIITVTTVGYGDVTPSTPAGYVICSLLAVCGILLLALSSAIVAYTFNDLASLNRVRARQLEIDGNEKAKNYLAMKTRIKSVNKIYVSEQ